MENETRSGAELVNPYNDGEPKGKQVEQMFDSIAQAYDFMNNAMTFGLHRLWRDCALGDALKECGIPSSILDIATGTGDLVFDLHRRLPKASLTGVDLSEGMIAEALAKLRKLPEEASRRIDFIKGDASALPLSDNSIDLITVAYGVRNFENLRAGYREMWRVLRPGGTLCVIELSCPANPVMRKFYDIYSRNIIPFVGKMVSGDSRAYSYLPESIAAAPQRDAMSAIIGECGFGKCRWKTMTFGAVTYYIATK